MIIFWDGGHGTVGGAASCDFPDESDVLLGVEYDNGNLVGTLSVGGTGNADCPSFFGNQDTQAFIPWTTEVTHTRVRPNATNVETVIDCAAVYRLGNGESSPAYGVFTLNDILVTFDRDSIPSTPKPRDTLLWGTDTYTVLEVNGSDFLDFWKCTARNIVAHADLRDLGTLSRPSTAQDSAYRQSLSSYSNVASDIPCRVQPADSSSGDVLGRRHMAKRYVAFVSQTLDARARDRFTVNSVEYTVLEWRDAEQIGEPNKLLLEKIG